MPFSPWVIWEAVAEKLKHPEPEVTSRLMSLVPYATQFEHLLD